MPQTKFKVKMSPTFNGETGSVFSISYRELKALLELKNRFMVEGFTVTKYGLDVFVDKTMAVGTPIKLPSKL